ncbi:MAG TPA: phosphatase PAP2 family protein [Gemmatimonadaceae bacterium]|nr:phosphatase PAP2 family protein [Gemmatimonadaceae bacterium]
MPRRWSIVLAIAPLLISCGDTPVEPAIAADVSAGEWRTWVIANGAALRPPAPPSNASAELGEIIALQQSVTPAENAMIQKWNTLPTTAWHNLALDLFGFYWILLPDVRLATPARSARAFALLHVAMYDALVATWDAKYAYDRVAPARADSRVRALVPVTDVPSYPSEHAAAAAAAAAVFTYLFPDEDTASFSALAREAGEARIAAGASYRSDVEAGYAIGRAVAAAVIERARTDGSDAAWAGTVPDGPTAWRPTPPRNVEIPFDPTAPQWRTWVIASPSVFRPPAPPAMDSPAFAVDLGELRQLSTSRTVAQADTARFWASESPSSRWEVFIGEEIARRGLTPMRAARALALASVATYDAMIACWDAKYTYWLMRPISADPTLKTVFSTPPFPSYPSGHSTLSSAVAEVFAELFPDAADYYRRKAVEASISRVLGGVHYRFDVTVGEHLGVQVGEAVVEWAREDGS